LAYQSQKMDSAEQQTNSLDSLVCNLVYKWESLVGVEDGTFSHGKSTLLCLLCDHLDLRQH